MVASIKLLVMIVRKYPSADLEQYSTLFFAIGLTASLLIVIIAFEWKFYGPDPNVALDDAHDGLFEEVLDIPPTTQPPPPPPKKSSFVQIVAVPDVEVIEENIEIDLDIDVSEETIVEEMIIEDVEVEEEADEIFVIVEKQPIPEGGFEAFYTYLYKAINYPRSAVINGVEGKVFVQFVVGKSGQLKDFKVVKGIGFGCDEEAVRALREAPPWQPGKQRGVAVNVRVIVPINFKLDE